MRLPISPPGLREAGGKIGIELRIGKRLLDPISESESKRGTSLYERSSIAATLHFTRLNKRRISGRVR